MSAASTEERGVTGPASHYRPKEPPSVSVALTAEGKQILADAAARTGASRGDVVEWLLRKFGDRVKFGK